MQLSVIQFTVKMFHRGFMQVLVLCIYSMYIKGQHESSVNIQTVYTANIQTVYTAKIQTVYTANTQTVYIQPTHRLYIQPPHRLTS